jgi:hypothetical protein
MRTLRNVIGACFLIVVVMTSDSTIRAYQTCWNWCAEPFIWARSCYWDYDEYEPGERYCWGYGPGNVALIAQSWCEQYAAPWDAFPNASVDWCEEELEWSTYAQDWLPVTDAQITCRWYRDGIPCEE